MLPKRRNPTHPGEVLLEEFLKPLNISVSKFVKDLGEKWNERRLESNIKGEEGISNETAHKFADLLRTTPEFWIHLQRIFDEGKKK
jgi:antitoxin HigA-1